MATPQDGWFGLTIRIAQESKSEEKFDEKIAKQLEAHEANGRVWDLLCQYDWRDAKRAAFVAPNYRMSVERSILKEVR